LIKILIVNLHYDLIMPNTGGCAVILQKKEGYEHVWTYFIYN